MDSITIYMKDIRHAKMCASGARRFFEAHALNWGLFLKEGISATKLLAISDAMAEKVVEVASGRKK